MKKYSVTFDVFLMEHIYVEARNKKEAVKLAKMESRFAGPEGAELKVFEVEEDK